MAASVSRGTAAKLIACAVVTGIENEQGYVIDRASMDRGSEDGLVNGQFRFQ